MLYGFFIFFDLLFVCASNTVLVLRRGHQGYWRNRKRACLASTRYWERNPDTPVRYGVVGNISACHADARGSIPRFGVLHFYPKQNFSRKQKKKEMVTAPAENQTRVSSVAGTYTITVLPAHMYSYSDLNQGFLAC